MVTLFKNKKVIFETEIKSTADARDIAEYIVDTENAGTVPMWIEKDSETIPINKSFLFEAIGNHILKTTKQLNNHNQQLKIPTKTPHQKKTARLINRIENEISIITNASQSVRAAEKSLHILNANVEFFHQLNDIEYQIDEISARLEEYKQWFRQY